MAFIYTTTDAAASVKAIANTADKAYYPNRDTMLVSLDGEVFTTVYYSSKLSGGYRYSGTVIQPALDIDGVAISYADDTLTYDGIVYVLDPEAVMAEVVTKPVMEITRIVETYEGYYVVAQNYIDGRLYHFHNGRPLALLRGSQERETQESDVVADFRYEGHRYLVRGDHMDATGQTATFDGLPAPIVVPEDYVATFADDLSTVTVAKK